MDLGVLANLNNKVLLSGLVPAPCNGKVIKIGTFQKAADFRI